MANNPTASTPAPTLATNSQSMRSIALSIGSIWTASSSCTTSVGSGEILSKTCGSTGSSTARGTAVPVGGGVGDSAAAAVAVGDTLSGLAWHYNISLQQLLQANNVHLRGKKWAARKKEGEEVKQEILKL